MAFLGRVKIPTRLFKVKASGDEKLKGRMKRIGDYFYNIYADYKTVAIETVQDMKNKPLKSSIYLSLLTACGVLLKTRPTEKNFKERLRECSNDLLLVAEPVRNPNTDQYLSLLLKLDNEMCLRYLNLGICTIVYKTEYPHDAGIFSARCKYVKPHFTKFHEQILDYGLFNRWIYLEKAVIDYDINTEEWLEDGSPRNKVKFQPLL